MRKGTSIECRGAEPAVVVRLVLFAVDEVSGEPDVVGSFLKQIAMPPDLAPGMPLTLDIFGERCVFHPTEIVWDEAQHICIVEVAWMASEAARSLEAMKVPAVAEQQRGVAR